MKAQILHMESGDEVALQYLGAAVVLQWESLPEAAQKLILQQADSVGGLPAIRSLHAQIDALLQRGRG